MNPKFTLHHLIAALGCTTIAVSSVHAADTDGTWTKNATGTQNWSDITNWSGGDVADGIGFSAYLSNVINASRTITLDSDRTIGNIYAQDTSNDYTISGANTLTLDTSSGQSVLDIVTGRTLNIGSAVTVNDGIEKNGAGALSITGAVTLGGAQTWTNNSTGTFSKTNASLIDNAGHQLTLDGSGLFNLGTINNATAVLTGSGALVKDGTGRVNIGGVNSAFTGTVAINGGVMQVTNNAGALGDGNLSLNGGVLSFYWGTTYTRSLGTGDNQVQILGGNSGFAAAGTAGATINLGTTVQWGSTHFQPGKFVLGDEGTTNVAPTTFSSGIDLNGGTRTILAPLGANNTFIRATISGAISNSTGTGNLIKEGGGYLLLSNNASAWNGTTTASEGLFDMGGINLANIGGGSGRNITVADGASIRFNTLTNAVLNRIVETTDEIGVMAGNDPTGGLDFSSSTGANLSNAFLGNFAGNGAKREITGTITPGSDGYKFGARYSSGNLGIRSAVTGDNTLTVGQTGGSGIRVTLAGAKDFTGQTVINAGARLTLGDNLSLQNSALNVGAAGGDIGFNEGTAATTITGNTYVDSPTFGGLIGSRNLSSVFTNAQGNNENNINANLVTGFTLNVADGNTFTYSGAIGGFGTGTTNNNGGGINGDSTLTKTGLGTQILSGTHTYTGATNINQGTLIINGSTSISSTVTVAAGATLGGTGTVGGNTTISGTHNPGNSPGIQTFTGDLSYVDAGTPDPTVNWELVGNTTTVGTNPNANFDQIIVGGNLDFTSDTFINLIFNGTGSTVLWSNTLWDTDQTWLVYDVAGTTTNFANLNLNTINWQDSGGNLFSTTGGAFALGQSGDDVLLNYTVIPEPSAALLGALGLLALFRRRRA